MSLVTSFSPEKVVQVIACFAAVSSAIVAVYVYRLTKRIDRQKEDAVLEWSKAAIDQLQTLALLCEHGDSLLPAVDARDAFARIAISTSVLLEQGRLFFRNSNHQHGEEKEPAYRGYRPVILDKLLIAHRTAIKCLSAEVGERKAFEQPARQNREKLVSLLQTEVARDRKAREYASQPGDQITDLRA